MDFLNNSIVITVLRLSHIFSGIIWVGFGAVGAWVLNPAVKKLGEKGDTLLRIFYGYSSYNTIFPIVAGITTLAGIILWGARADGAQLQGFTDVGSGIMGIGAIFGILAAGHGGGATGRFAKKYADAARAYEEAESPSEEQTSELAELRAKVFTHSNISAWLTVIAAVAMASARYL